MESWAEMVEEMIMEDMEIGELMKLNFGKNLGNYFLNFRSGSATRSGSGDGDHCGRDK